MAKIAIIGAGGVIFTQNLIKDILLDEQLKTSHVTLMDIDAGRLANAGKMSAIVAEQFSVEFHPELTTDLHQAVHNADYATLFGDNEQVFEIQSFATDESAEVVEKQGKTDRYAILATENDLSIVLYEK